MKRIAEQPETDSLRPSRFAGRAVVPSDYETVKPSKGMPAASTYPRALEVPTPPTKRNSNVTSEDEQQAEPRLVGKLKRGHGLTFIGLCLFTVVLYTRPAEFYPSPWTASIALIVALATLAVYLPTQLSLEGNLTARPTEVNLILLFLVTGVLSIPLAISPELAWSEFSGTFIRCVVMFIVIVNVLRTRAQLKGLILIALISAIWLSGQAINDFRLGLATVEGYRAGGRGNGIFGNTNDMALHIVTLFPIAVAMLFGSKNLFGKVFYAAVAVLMMAGIVLSYSRGAFLGLIVVLIFLATKLGHRHRVGIVLAIGAVASAVLLFSPDNYGGRLLSIFVPSLDQGGSASFRRGELLKSINVSLRRPLFGVGMGNYQTLVSFRNHVTHNAYTQVSVEMGMAALVCYTMFIVKPLRKLGQIARETFATRRNSQYYYLTVGLQGALLGYMTSSFFLSVAYLWYVYYLVGFAVCLRRLYEAETGREVVVEKRKERRRKGVRKASIIPEGAVTT